MIIATNTTASVVDIDEISVVGADLYDFIEQNTCGVSLKAHEGCSIVVQFVPTSTGSQSAAISFTIKDGNFSNPKNLALSATGTN